LERDHLVYFAFYFIIDVLFRRGLLGVSFESNYNTEAMQVEQTNQRSSSNKDCRLGSHRFESSFLRCCLQRASISDNEIEDIESEIRFLGECKSAYCVEYFGSFLKEHQLYIVMEHLAGGSVAEQVELLLGNFNVLIQALRWLQDLSAKISSRS
jgi:serine/threonine protein kinase